MKYIGKAFRILLCLALLALLFVASRLVVVLLGWEASWTTVLFLTVVIGYFLIRWLLFQVRRIREERRAVKLLETDKPEEDTDGKDPQLAAHMHLTWKSGLAFLSKSRIGRFNSSYSLPWYLSLNLTDNQKEGSRIVQTASVHGANPEALIPNPEFHWVFARKAVWLDLDFASKPDADTYWPPFMRELIANRGKAPLGGITVTLDARELLEKREADIREQAATLRARLDVIIKITGARVPVYLFVDRIDQLYGMRSLVQALPPSRLDKPFGAFRIDEEEIPGDFAQRLLGDSATAISVAARAAMRETRSAVDAQTAAQLPPGEAAAVQGPDELLRLGSPLALFCGEAFSDNPYHMVPFLRGVFFGTSGPEGDTITPKVSDFSSLHFEHENPEPGRQWFWRELVEEQIPSDPAPIRAVRRRRHVRAVTLHAGLAALLVSTLGICTLMTHSFSENRELLRLMDGKVAMPVRQNQLTAYLDNTKFVNDARMSWWHPRLGMSEADSLAEEMKKRFCEAYLEVSLRPEFWELYLEIQNIAEEKDPKNIGKLMLFLAVIKDSLENDVNDIQLIDALLHNLHMKNPDDRRKLMAYMEWGQAGAHEITREDIVTSERHIIETAMGGDPMQWLPEWVESLPNLASVNLSTVASPLVVSADILAKSQISSAWTHEGYAMVEALLNSLVQDDDSALGIWEAKRDQILSKYRLAALKEWSDSTVNLWKGINYSFDDSALPMLIRNASFADDPAMRVISLMSKRLLPMFDENDANPEVRWLRAYSQLTSILKPALMAESTADHEPGFVDKVKGTVTSVTRRIGSQAGAELLARNLGLLSSGSEFATALEQLQRLMRAFGVINTTSLAREQCLEMVRQQFIIGSHPGFSPIALAQSSGGGQAGGGNGQERSRDPFGDANKAASDLEQTLFELTNSTLWTHIGPKSSYHYMRFLLVRLCASYLDGIWFNTVYNPAQLATGTNEETREKLIGAGGLIDTFMGGPSQGFWRRENRRLANAVWDEISFRFTREFLAYCDTVVELSRTKQPDTLSLGFRVDAVSVNQEAKERPHTVLFTMREAGAEEQYLVYQNYNVSTAFAWNMDPNAEMAIRLEFPSLALTKTFAGQQALGRFIRTFAQGFMSLTPEDFPEQADALKRLGVTRIAVRATMRNHEALLKHIFERVPELPRSIVRYSMNRNGNGQQEETTNSELPKLESFLPSDS